MYTKMEKRILATITIICVITGLIASILLLVIAFRLATSNVEVEHSSYHRMSDIVNDTPEMNGAWSAAYGDDCRVTQEEYVQFEIEYRLTQAQHFFEGN